MKTSYQVLSSLYQEEVPMSGQDLGDKLDLSRNSIWKAIEALRSKGHVIEAGPKGYRLVELTKDLDQDSLRLFLGPSWENAYIEVYDQSPSTNVLAKNLMDQAKDRVLIVSKCQENGKGRQGKSFHSPKGGLYFSFAYRPDKGLESNALLTISIGLALVETFKDLYDLDIGIKWVNDLIYKEKKVAGILTEASLSLEDMALDYLVVGSGLNIYKTEPYPENLEKIAGPIFEKENKNFNPNVLIGRSIDRFFAIKDDKDLIERYKAVCTSLGKTFDVKEGKKTYRGKAIDIDKDGSLIMEIENGQLVSLSGNY